MNDSAFRTLLACMLVLTVGCGGDGPIEPEPDPLTIETDGRLERGALIQLTVGQGSTQPAGVTLTAVPAAAVQWEAPDMARLLAAGQVTFQATSSDATGSLVVDVVVPPLITFESTQSGSRDVWRMALDGGDVLRLTDHPSEDASPSSAGGDVFFLSYRVSPAAVFSVPAGGGAAAQVTTVAAQYVEPGISPDGQSLVFLRTVGGVSKIFISARSGANARRATTSGGGVIEVSPAWSPDGRTLVFVSTAAGNADVYTVPVAGGTPVSLGATDQPEVEPAWSPNGAHVVFVRGSGGQADLWVVPAAGGQPNRLTTRDGIEARPAWLADGRVVFTVSDGAQRLLHWVDPDDAGTLHRIPHEFDVAGRAVGVR